MTDRNTPLAITLRDCAKTFADGTRALEPLDLAINGDGFFTTKSDGTGAGLAFCKRTVLNFDGQIEVHSVQGEYAEFAISLPVFRGAS